ncbi:hypothetical protein [Anatilimnocola floriformis]|uniref:hypothetical protein n=1 Tax=Anatilimnocola floriformis TaxID=2948575 RepID=UPI0020C1F37B|nr:hypothetical protein [Anatilimnocola floriformis]
MADGVKAATESTRQNRNFAELVPAAVIGLPQPIDFGEIDDIVVVHSVNDGLRLTNRAPPKELRDFRRVWQVEIRARSVGERNAEAKTAAESTRQIQNFAELVPAVVIGLLQPIDFGEIDDIVVVHSVNDGLRLTNRAPPKELRDFRRVWQVEVGARSVGERNAEVKAAAESTRQIRNFAGLVPRRATSSTQPTEYRVFGDIVVVHSVNDGLR